MWVIEGVADTDPSAGGLVRFASRPWQLANVMPTTFATIVKTLRRARGGLTMAAPVAAMLGSMAEAALAPEQIDPQTPYPRLHWEPYGVAALVIPFT